MKNISFYLLIAFLSYAGVSSIAYVIATAPMASSLEQLSSSPSSSNNDDTDASYFSLNKTQSAFTSTAILQNASQQRTSISMADSSPQINKQSNKLAEIQYNIGLDYLAQHNSNLAARWMSLSAQQGFVPAQYDLAMMYLQGIGVEKQPLYAIGWLYKAAKQGYLRAQNDLTWLFDQGQHLWKNDYANYRRNHYAATKGDEAAQNQLDDLFGKHTEVLKAFQHAVAHHEASFVRPTTLVAPIQVGNV